MRESQVTYSQWLMVDLEGFEHCTVVDSTQLIDSTKRQKRPKRSKRQFEVHGGYTDCCAGALGVRKSQSDNQAAIRRVPL